MRYINLHFTFLYFHVQGGPKSKSQILSISSPNIDGFSKIFTATFCGKFVIKWLLNVPPHLNYFLTYPVGLFKR